VRETTQGLCFLDLLSSVVIVSGSSDPAKVPGCPGPAQPAGLAQMASPGVISVLAIAV